MLMTLVLLVLIISGTASEIDDRPSSDSDSESVDLNVGVVAVVECNFSPPQLWFMLIQPISVLLWAPVLLPRAEALFSIDC